MSKEQTWTIHTVRGGSWGNSPEFARSACRARVRSNLKDNDQGFRVVRALLYPNLINYGTGGGVICDVDAPLMVCVPGGTFVMGDDSKWSDEYPAHDVSVDAFAIGRYPITVGEYLRFVEATGLHRPEWAIEGGTYHIETGEDDWYRKAGIGHKKTQQPVTGISWHDAVAYCEWLSEKTGRPYSLPTEAQWEYACRAGSTTRYCFGDDVDQLGDYAWTDDNADTLKNVGEKLPNDWKIYDMHGLVWEWTGSPFSDYSK